MISSGRHPKKDIADALRRADSAGLLVKEIHRGHRWGEVTCVPCQASRGVWATPREPGTHAKQIDRFTRSHSHSSSAERSVTF
jgi:hypothetical protein